MTAAVTFFRDRHPYGGLFVFREYPLPGKANMVQISGSQVRLRRLLVAALFVALAYVSRFVFHFNVAFLTFECKDALIAVGGMFLGPLWALGMSLATALIEFVTISDTGWYGLVMNFCAAAAFSCVASLVYRYRRTLGGAIGGLVAGVAALVAVMLPLNLLVTPAYMGVAVSKVVALLPKLLLPFNLLKGVMNMAVVLLLYKPLTRALRAAHLAEQVGVPGTVVTVAPDADADSSEPPPALPEGYIGGMTGGDGSAVSPVSSDNGNAPAAVNVPATPVKRWWKRWLAPLLGVTLLLVSLLVFFLALHGKVTVGK